VIHVGLYVSSDMLRVDHDILVANTTVKVSNFDAVVNQRLPSLPNTFTDRAEFHNIPPIMTGDKVLDKVVAGGFSL
jgi:hypothetical protein